MSKFSLDKKGYNTKEVNDYINNLYLKYEEKLSEQKDRVFALKSELEKAQARLDHYIEKDKQISQALIYAVEKADEIESASKKIYELEIKRVRLLYKRWEELLLEVESKYPQINNNSYIYSLLDSFKASINDVLEQNFNLNNSMKTAENLKQNLKKNGDSYIKNILNKMEYAFSSQPEAEKTRVTTPKQTIKKIDISNVMSNHEKEQSRMNALSNRLNVITNSLSLKSNEDLVDGYLNSDLDDEFANTAYAKNITRKKITPEDNSPFNYAYPTPNDSGFDLKEALNPKEDLDEIMKAFDFFDEH